MWYVFFWVIPRRVSFKKSRQSPSITQWSHPHSTIYAPSPSTTCCDSTHPVRSLSLPLAVPLSHHNPFRYKYTARPIPSHSSSTCPWRWNRQRVPKRRLLEPRRRGITQKKTYYIFLSSPTLHNAPVFLNRSVLLIFSVLLQHHISTLSKYFWSTFTSIQFSTPLKSCTTNVQLQ